MTFWVILIVAWFLGRRLRRRAPVASPDFAFHEPDEDGGEFVIREELDDWWDAAYGGIETRAEMQ